MRLALASAGSDPGFVEVLDALGALKEVEIVTPLFPDEFKFGAILRHKITKKVQVVLFNDI